ncbi:hypothetical protein ACLBYG_22050 [Methylobacterium sp. D53M]
MRKDNQNWTAALARLKTPRPARNPVREERLKTVSLVSGGSAKPLSAWRGRSKRRYVVGVHDAHVTKALLQDEPNSVVILAVRRPEVGEALIIDARDAVPGSVRSWVEAVVSSGATELHVHRLAENAAERAAILDDLIGCDPQDGADDDAEPSDAA